MGSFLDGIDSVLDAADDVVSGLERVVYPTRPGSPAPRGGPPRPGSPAPGRAHRGSSVEEVVDAQTRQTEYVVRTAEGTVVCSSAELASRVRDSLG